MAVRTGQLLGCQRLPYYHAVCVSNPKRLKSRLRGDLDWIVVKALEKDRARRYETANGLAADVRRHLNHEPVLARAPSPAYRPSERSPGRHRVLLAGASALGVTLIAAVQRCVRSKHDVKHSGLARHELERTRWMMQATYRVRQQASRTG